MYAIINDALCKGQQCMVSQENKVSFFSQRHLTEFSFDEVFSKNSQGQQASLQSLMEAEANDLLNNNGSNVYLIFEALGDSSFEKPHSIVSTFVQKAKKQASLQLEG